MPLMLGPIYQIAHVVFDLDAAVERWVRASGAGPFFVARHFEMTDPQLYGAPASCDVSIALGFSQGLCVELITFSMPGSTAFTTSLGSLLTSTPPSRTTPNRGCHAPSEREC